MAAAPYVVDLDVAHAVVVPDWHSYYGLLGDYCGERKFDGSLARGRDLYILCHDATRAEDILAALVKYPFTVAQEIAIGRKPTYGTVATELLDRGHAVACDALGPDCDDERLKALHPAPAGPMIDFQWITREKRYRMRCLATRRDGSTSSERIVLKDGPDWKEAVAKGYRRFSRKKAPEQATLSCLPHVAAALSRLDSNGAARLARWRAEMDSRGVDEHQEVRPLLIPAASIDSPGDLLSIEIRGMRGSYLLSSDCRYHGGTSIVDRTLDLTASLPETLVAGLVGLPASTIWGDPDLAGMTISRSARAPGIGFMLDGDVLSLPVPAPPPPDEEDAQAALDDLGFGSDMSIEGIVLLVLSPLPASVRLDIYRTLLCREESRIDIAGWLPNVPHPVILARDHLLIRHYSSGYCSRKDGISL